MKISVYRDALGRGGWPDEREDIGLHDFPTPEAARAAAELHAGEPLVWGDGGMTGELSLTNEPVEYYLVDPEEEARVPDNEYDFLNGEDPAEFEKLVQDIRAFMAGTD